MDTKQLANVLAATLAETDAEVPEGHLYAAVMGHTGLDQFQTCVDVLAKLGLIERKSGPCVKSTPKLRALVSAYKQEAR